MGNQFVVHQGKVCRGQVFHELVVDLLPRLRDIIEPGTIPDKLLRRRRNLSHHLRVALALKHQMIVTVLFMLQTDNRGLNLPDRDFRDSISNALERRRIFGGILQFRRAWED